MLNWFHASRLTKIICYNLGHRCRGWRTLHRNRLNTGQNTTGHLTLYRIPNHLIDRIKTTSIGNVSPGVLVSGLVNVGVLLLTQNAGGKFMNIYTCIYICIWIMRETYMCVCVSVNNVNIGSENCLRPVRREAIISLWRHQIEIIWCFC